MQRDLSGFNPRSFPHTEYHEALEQDEMPLEVRFLADADVEPRAEWVSGVQLFDMYRAWCSTQGVPACSLIHLGRRLRMEQCQQYLQHRVSRGKTQWRLNPAPEEEAEEEAAGAT